MFLIPLVICQLNFVQQYKFLFNFTIDNKKETFKWLSPNFLPTKKHPWGDAKKKEKKMQKIYNFKLCQVDYKVGFQEGHVYPKIKKRQGKNDFIKVDISYTVVWMGKVGRFPLFSLKIIHSNIPIIQASNYHMRMLRVDVNTHYSDISLAYKLRVGWILNTISG